MNTYKILFSLESEELVVLEIKRLGLPEGTEKSKVYSWLLFDKKDSSIEQLIFKSMNSEANKESRSFEQAELQFNKIAGSILFSGKEYLLTVNDLSAYEIPPNLRDAITIYLSK